MTRYTGVAITLHWVIAVLLIGNLGLGLWMVEAINQQSLQARAAELYQLHKSIGLSILLLSVVRLAWRLLHTPPAPPAQMSQWQLRGSKFVHASLYALMLAIPLSGWLYVSTQWRNDSPLSVPTLWFGWIEVPHLFGLNELAQASRALWADRLHEIHELLAGLFALLLLGHVGAALKHQFMDRDGLMLRMLPRRRGLSLAVVAGLLAVGVLALQQGASDSGASVRQISSSGWLVDADKSAIRFSGLHAGDSFSGEFQRWHVDFDIDAAQPESGKIVTTINTGSARTGDKLRDETLPQAEWFAAAEQPTATFESSGIQAVSEQEFRVSGTLEIKGRKLDIAPLDLVIRDGVASIDSEVIVDRAAFDLGMSSDPSGEWVSREIRIQVRLQAKAP